MRNKIQRLYDMRQLHISIAGKFSSLKLKKPKCKFPHRSTRKWEHVTEMALNLGMLGFKTYSRITKKSLEPVAVVFQTN